MTVERNMEKAKQSPPEFGEGRTITARKAAESILLFTQEVGIQQDNNNKR